MQLGVAEKVAICIFMIVHLVGTVWWMSKVQTTLCFLADSVAKVISTIAGHEATFVNKVDNLEKLAGIVRQMEKIEEKCENCTNYHKSTQKHTD